MLNTSRVIRSLAAFAIALPLAMGAARAADTSTPDDTAHFLAGLPPKADSPLAKIAGEGAWKQHARYFDSAWAQLDKQQLSRIRTWSAQNLTKPEPTLFYMFSGPDFLYADAFFPNANTYVLSGLEPVGQIPELTSLARGRIGGELSGLRASLSSVLSYSFFITEKMKHQLRAGKVNGTLPVLYVFLARSGKTIEDVSFVALDEEGNVHPADEAGLKSSSKGVKIGFAGGDGRKHTLYYFSTDLSNGGVKNPGFLKFCEKLGNGDAFIKSASYLLHSGGFTTVRDFLLKQTKTLVQDDSGIPVVNFKTAEWDLRPHGRYLGPIEVFPGRYQGKLAQLFRKAPEINFGIGYRWRPRESNLLVAVKKVPAATAQTEPPKAEEKKTK